MSRSFLYHIFFQVLYVLCFTRPRYHVSVYRTIGPLVSYSSLISDAENYYLKNLQGFELCYIHDNCILQGYTVSLACSQCLVLDTLQLLFRQIGLQDVYEEV